MSGFVVDGVLVSSNSKTGLSINVDQCTPTKWCRPHCYRVFRTHNIIAHHGWSTTPNTGPISWPRQTARYKANERAVIEAAREGYLCETAGVIARSVRKRGMAALRGNGSGDLFPALCELYANICKRGVRVYGYSKRPQMLHRLKQACQRMDVPEAHWPYFLGSTDVSSEPDDVFALAHATAHLNTDREPALAYSTESTGVGYLDELQTHPDPQAIKVVFGYHTNFKTTVVGCAAECPATAGEDVHCHDCKRCFGPAEGL